MNAVLRGLHKVEDLAIFALFLATIGLPLYEAAARPFPALQLNGSAVYLKHVVLWLAFMGGMLATRERKHLQLSTAEMLPKGRWRQVVNMLVGGFAASVAAQLARANWFIVEVNREQGATFTLGLPTWVSDMVMPVALGIIALRFVWHAGAWKARVGALLLVPATFLLDYAPELVSSQLWTLTGVVLVAAVLGAPVFIAMAALGMLFLFEGDTPVVAMSAEIYRLISSPTIPAIPLLTVCGYVLAEANAAQRLVRFFKALFGWMPGGIAVLVASVCAVFTTFTGGSGVTIIALGGLVYGILREADYPERFSLGLVTASGSLGLLFPPSLPVILYAVVVSASPEFTVAADDLYIAGLLPGLLLVVLVAGYGVWVGRKVEKERPKFELREVAAATWEAKWELSVPIIVIVLFASGWASMVEAAAAAAAYSLVVECFITKDIHPVRDLPGVLARAGVLVGAVLILLAAAFGLSYFVIAEAELPDVVLSLIEQHITQPWVFLLALNGLLLLLGAVLEIYSAIVIIPPILVPLALHYGIDPIHLGVIFLANLELGFISPPIGLNLFLAASRFDKPMLQVYRSVVPYLFIMVAGVLLITYVPAISVGVVKVFNSEPSTPATEEASHVPSKDNHLAQPPLHQVAADAEADPGGGDRARGEAVPDRWPERGGAEGGVEGAGPSGARPDAPGGERLQGPEARGGDRRGGADPGDGRPPHPDRAPPGPA